MDDMEDSITFKLQKPVKYGKENKETEFVEIKCPSYETVGQRRYRRNLKAMLASIIMEENQQQDTSDINLEEAQNKLKEKEAEPFTAGQVLLTVSAALGDDFSKAIDIFCEHAKDFCLLGGEESLKSGTMGRMHPDDVDMMFCTFIANFIMPSLLKSLSGSE